MNRRFPFMRGRTAGSRGEETSTPVDYVWEYSGANPQAFTEPGTNYTLGVVSDARWHTSGQWTIDVVPTEDATAYSARHVAWSNNSNRLRLQTNIVELRVAGVAYSVNVAGALNGDTLTIRVNHGVEIGVRINGGAESVTAITGGETWSSQSASSWYIGNNSSDSAGLNGSIYQPVGS